MNAYVQTDIHGVPASLNFYQSRLGFQELGYWVEEFYWDAQHGMLSPHDGMPVSVLDKETVISAGIPIIDKAFETLGVENPYLEDYPEELRFWMKRDYSVRPMREIREMVMNGTRSFIKPLAKNRKIFTGHVVSEFKDLIRTAGVPDDTLIVRTSIVDFRSEYRVFVHKNRIIGLKHYKGDYLIFPNKETILLMINEYTSAPIAYAIDVGVTASGSTVLVEVNDATALGCYGLGPVTYAKMIIDRWNQICKNED